MADTNINIKAYDFGALSKFVDFATSKGFGSKAAQLNPDATISTATTTASWHARRSKHPTQNAQTAANNNNLVRDALVEALKKDFNAKSFEGLPDGVKKALKGTFAKSAAGDFGFRNGKSASGKPLTKRRIAAVLKAAAKALDKMKKEGADSCCGSLYEGSLSDVDLC